MIFNYTLVDKSNYPHLFSVLRMIVMDNYGESQFVQNFPVPTSPKLSLVDLEATASALTDEEKWALAAGEAEEQKEIYERSTSLTALWVFLNHCFDGELDSCYSAV